MSQMDTMLAMLTDATHEVFETMVNTTLDARSATKGGVMTAPCGVLGVIAFAGDYSGSVSFYSSEDTALKVTSAMMGMPATEVNGEMADAVGEITNMIAGTFRTKMATRGTRWAISTPSVTVGWQLRTKHYGTVHTGLCEFAMPSGDVMFVELVLTEQ
jgi:chemotaxis protein CheX